MNLQVLESRTLIACFLISVSWWIALNIFELEVFRISGLPESGVFKKKSPRSRQGVRCQVLLWNALDSNLESLTVSESCLENFIERILQQSTLMSLLKFEPVHSGMWFSQLVQMAMGSRPDLRSHQTKATWNLIGGIHFERTPTMVGIAILQRTMPLLQRPALSGLTACGVIALEWFQWNPKPRSVEQCSQCFQTRNEQGVRLI